MSLEVLFDFSSVCRDVQDCVFEIYEIEVCGHSIVVFFVLVMVKLAVESNRGGIISDFIHVLNMFAPSTFSYLGLGALNVSVLGNVDFSLDFLLAKGVTNLVVGLLCIFIIGYLKLDWLKFTNVTFELASYYWF